MPSNDIPEDHWVAAASFDGDVTVVVRDDGAVVAARDPAWVDTANARFDRYGYPGYPPGVDIQGLLLPSDVYEYHRRNRARENPRGYEFSNVE